MSEVDFSARRARFRELHQSGGFVIPNPWDVGTTRYLESLGFQAMATTSAGLAFSLGLPDGAVTREAVLCNIWEIVNNTHLPVNADFEAGYAKDAAGVAESVRLCVGTGVSGLSIEDATGDRLHPLYDLADAIERMKAARGAIDATGTGVLLTGRAECFLVGHAQPLTESIRRLQAYAEAGADVVYAPGLKTPEDILTVVRELSPKPVNVLMSANLNMTVEQVLAMGVRRISVGSSLARSAWTGFMRAAKLIAEEGSFAGFDGLAPYAELNEFFRKHQK